MSYVGAPLAGRLPLTEKKRNVLISTRMTALYRVFDAVMLGYDRLPTIKKLYHFVPTT